MADAFVTLIMQVSGIPYTYICRVSAIYYTNYAEYVAFVILIMQSKWYLLY